MVGEEGCRCDNLAWTGYFGVSGIEQLDDN